VSARAAVAPTTPPPSSLLPSLAPNARPPRGRQARHLAHNHPPKFHERVPNRRRRIRDRERHPAVARSRERGLDREPDHVRDAKLGLNAGASASAKRAVQGAVVAGERRHVLGDGDARHRNARKHAHALGDVHVGQLLGGGDHDGGGELDGLREGGRVSPARARARAGGGGRPPPAPAGGGRAPPPPAPHQAGPLTTPAAAAAAALVGLSTTAVLFCSHFHQVAGDRAAGKRSPLVRLGGDTAAGAAWLGRGVGGAYALLAVAALAGWLPMPASLTALALSWAPARTLLARAAADHGTPPRARTLKLAALGWHGGLGAGLCLGLAGPAVLASARAAGLV